MMTAAKKKTAKRRSKLTSLEQQISNLKATLPAQQDWCTTDQQEILSETRN